MCFGAFNSRFGGFLSNGCVEKRFGVSSSRGMLVSVERVVITRCLSSDETRLIEIRSDQIRSDQIRSDQIRSD